MSVAFCILTKDHSDILLESSVLYFEEMASRDIDIYLYDSSNDTRTHSLVSAWNERGCPNVYWVDCRFTAGADQKVVLVYSGLGLRKNYDYIWLSKDRIVLAAAFLDRILADMDNRPDVIITGKEEDGFFYDIPRYKDVYHNPTELFRDFGAITTSWESVVLRRDTMIVGVDWEDYERRYGIGVHNPFNQTVFLFARLAEMSLPFILIQRPGHREKVFHSGTGSTWLSMTFELWGEKWPAAIKRLPEIYDKDKDYVIKTETMHPNIFGSMDILIRLKKLGYLNEESFEAIRDNFENLSDIPADYVALILQEDWDILAGKVKNDFKTAMEQNDYYRAYWIHHTNSWMSEKLDRGNYSDWEKLFKRYQQEMREQGYSNVFEYDSLIE